MAFSIYTNKSSQEVLEIFKTSENGLTKKECILHQQEFGLNEIKTRSINAFEILLRQIKSPFAYLLLAAAVISILIGQVVDSIAVLVFIFINVVIGFFQEFRAERAVVLLQKFIAFKNSLRSADFAEAPSSLNTSKTSMPFSRQYCLQRLSWSSNEVPLICSSELTRV